MVWSMYKMYVPKFSYNRSTLPFRIKILAHTNVVTVLTINVPHPSHHNHTPRSLPTYSIQPKSLFPSCLPRNLSEWFFALRVFFRGVWGCSTHLTPFRSLTSGHTYFRLAACPRWHSLYSLCIYKWRMKGIRKCSVTSIRSNTSKVLDSVFEKGDYVYYC